MEQGDGETPPGPRAVEEELSSATTVTVTTEESPPAPPDNLQNPDPRGGKQQTDVDGVSDASAPASVEEDGDEIDPEEAPKEQMQTPFAPFITSSTQITGDDTTQIKKSPSVRVKVPNVTPIEVEPTIVELPEPSIQLPTKKEDSSGDGDDDDVASSAAMALAAVAAAASAKNKSPAEAAREARAVAQSFITSASEETAASAGRKNSDTPSTLQPVSLSAVRTTLRQRALETGSKVLDKLGQGDNDSFLQVLLLMEYYRCIDDISSAVAKEEEESLKQSTEIDEKDPLDNADANTYLNKEKEAMNCSTRATEACERLEAILKRVEGAYDSLVNLLPATSYTYTENLGDYEENEAPVVVPDLLPPCAPPHGDPTLAFFRACIGDSSNSKKEDRRAFSVESPREETAEIDRDNEAVDQPLQKETTNSSKQTSMFTSMFRRSSAKSSIGGVFRRKSNRSSLLSKAEEGSVRSSESVEPPVPASTRNGEYIVRIEREMLGLTVENVLERTVVRTVAPAGPAKKAGAKVGSLIVKVGNVETKNLTHFETIDELRQSNRPLQLVLRQISDDSLRSAREEMGRLIKGAGFGNMMEGNRLRENTDPTGEGGKTVRPLIEADLRIDAYTSVVRRRFAEAHPPPKHKKEEALAKVGEKLVWILVLFVVGLERESKRLFALADASGDQSAGSPRRNPHSVYHHTAKDYADAAKSVSKVLYDYVRKNLDFEVANTKPLATGFNQQSLDSGVRKGRKVPPPPPMPGRGGRGSRRLPTSGKTSHEDSSMIHEKPLLQIGDVLQRTRTFLADTISPPAALLRGELISFLCDVLDIDTDMELAEEESVSSTAGSGPGAGAINDLGSAGSLLKLIVLNCPIMRSPSCEEGSSSQPGEDPDLQEELRRRFGTRQELSSDDLHRLHAGNRFLAVVHRLAASRSTSARITACSLGPVLWGHLDFPHQLQLRGVITRALHDVEVMVRKATATVLHEIAELVFDPRSVPWLVLMCERAMTDPEPQLRSAAMTLTWHLADHLPNAFLGDASQGSRYLRRLPSRDDPTFPEVYLLQCKLLPVATRLAEDRSPSVRLAVAAQCDRLCDALGAHWSSVVIDALLALLSDSDERVRCEAVSCVPRLAEVVLLSTTPGELAPSEISILEALIPASIKLQKDKSVSVRVALAAAAGDLLTLLVALQGHGETASEQPTSERSFEGDGNKKYKRQVDERLIPLVQILLNDSDPEVTSSALRAVTNATRSSANQARTRQMSIASEDDSASISSYASHASREKPVFLPVLSEVQVLRLLPTLTELGNSRQWRVRQSAVEIVPALLGCTQKLGTRSEIAKLCIRLMGDQVDAVRKTAAECLCMGASSLGSHGEDASAEWISSIVIPTIRKAAVHTECKQRLLSLKMVEVLLLSGGCPTKWKGESGKEDRMTDSPIRELAAIALSLTTDRIANVRLNVGRSLETVLHLFEEDEISFIQEVLLLQLESEKERHGGGDRDVLYFAQRCLTKAKAILAENRNS